MKVLIVLTALLALATAARIPTQKLESSNQLIQENENQNYDNIQEQEERNSLSNSFDTIANVIHQYKNVLTEDSESNYMKDEISIPDTVNVGISADTFLSSILVKGLRNFNSQNITMSWGEDIVNAENSWEKLIVNGAYHYINSAARFSGVFEIVLVEPKYSGNTSLTKNTDNNLMMFATNSITFKKVIINHTKLPEVFQNEKPQFGYFIKNVLSQYIATAVSNNMNNDITMRIRQTARPYLVYQSNKIASDTTPPATGQLKNGNQYELKNFRFDNTKNSLAKVSFVQMNYTNEKNTAVIELRLLDVTGESDLTITSEGKDYSGKVAYKFDRVKIIPSLNFNDKSVHTNILINTPQVELKPQETGSAAWMNAEEQLAQVLVASFTQQLAEATNQNIQNNI